MSELTNIDPVKLAHKIELIENRDANYKTNKKWLEYKQLQDRYYTYKANKELEELSKKTQNDKVAEKIKRLKSYLHYGDNDGISASK